MELETKIKKMRRFIKDLSALSFNVSTNKDEVVIKFREKYVLVKCPDKDIAGEMCSKLNYTLQFNIGRYTEIIKMLDEKCVQLSCFTEDNKPITQEEEGENAKT